MISFAFLAKRTRGSGTILSSERCCLVYEAVFFRRLKRNISNDSCYSLHFLHSTCFDHGTFCDKFREKNSVDLLWLINVTIKQQGCERNFYHVCLPEMISKMDFTSTFYGSKTEIYFL